MKRLSVFASVATIAATISVPALANGPKAGKPASSHASSPSPKNGGGRASHDADGSKHGPSSSSKSGSSVKSGSPSDTSTRTASTGSTPTFPPNAISAKISKNPNQLARVQAMLPANMTIEEATSGFRNQGQFIAAVNVSKNRNLPFADLKKAMTEDGLSLGQAARKVRHTDPVPAPAQTASGAQQ